MKVTFWNKIQFHPFWMVHKVWLVIPSIGIEGHDPYIWQVCNVSIFWGKWSVGIAIDDLGIILVEDGSTDETNFLE